MTSYACGKPARKAKAIFERRGRQIQLPSIPGGIDIGSTFSTLRTCSWYELSRGKILP
jgi:hypothetical protein